MNDRDSLERLIGIVGMRTTPMPDASVLRSLSRSTRVKKPVQNLVLKTI